MEIDNWSDIYIIYSDGYSMFLYEFIFNVIGDFKTKNKGCIEGEEV